MVTYVETNFVLELVLEQAEAAAAEELLSFAEASRLDVALHAFALNESITTLVGKAIARKAVADSLADEIGQLARSEDMRSLVDEIAAVPTQLEQIQGQQVDALERAGQRRLNCARLIDLDRAAFGEAFAFQREFDLNPADSFILASVLSDRTSRSDQALFISRDRKAFLLPRVRTRLNDAGCDVILSLTDGAARVRSMLS